MKKYLIIIEKSETGYSAYSPDVDGCIAVGNTIDECRTSMEEALKFHIELMLEKGYEIPKPSTRRAEYFNYRERKLKKKRFEVV